MALFDMFNKQQPAAPAQPAQQQAQQQPTQQQVPAGVAGNPTVPSTNNTPGITDPATGQQIQSPLDNFADIWKTDPTQQKPQQSFSLNADPAKFMEAAKQINFSQVVSPDSLQKIVAGGEDAVTALTQVLNQVSQATYAQSALANAKIMEAAFSNYGQQSETKMQEMIRKFSVSDSIKSENPLYSHPAMAPIVGALETQLTTKYPNASNAEIKGMVGKYLESMSSAFGTKSNEATPKPDETDWEAFMGAML